ncbi:hypothetical protein FB451DRAFT_1208454 [Mycena latifolia]|nr:hypothetical protein FB451DRAFT_1208454 [Mycena latifolia]
MEKRPECSLSLAGKRNRKILPELSYNTSDVPPELWEIVASFASRQSVARLCSLSREFCSTFSALLYSDLINPSLSPSQSSRLIKRLGAAQTSSWKPHPATLIRQLDIPDGSRDRFRSFQDVKAKAQALRGALGRIALSEPTKGSALRVLHWNFPNSLKDLGEILETEYFPNLRELAISSNETSQNFDFIQIGALEILKIEFGDNRFGPEDHEIGTKAFYKLAEAMQMLPRSSPLLHALHLNLKISSYGDPTVSPKEGRHDPVAIINSIHFPVLTALDLSVTVYLYLSLSSTGCDFFPFLRSHPNLLDLTLHTSGTKLTNDVSFLPRLRSFKGSFEDAAAICACQRPLDKLVLTFVQSHDFSYKLPQFPTIPLPTHLSLTKLQVRAVDTIGTAVKMSNISPASLARLVASFPNLTHLDICLHKPIPIFRHSLILLTKLQSLRIQEYRTKRPNSASNTWRVKKINDYIEELNSFLSFLPHLTHIDVGVWADNGEFWVDSEDDRRDGCDQDDVWADSDDEFTVDFSLPKMKGHYSFSVVHPVNRKGKRVKGISGEV